MNASSDVGAALDLEYRPDTAGCPDLGIASVGCGAIVNAAHLPAYRSAGFRVVGCFDVDRDVAEATAARFEIDTVYRSLDDLLADDRVQVVDIAVPAWEQRRIAERVAASGRHLLCQKPLAETYDDARAIVGAARAANVKLAVNQQMRWSPGIRATHTLVRRGWLGRLTLGAVTVNVRTPWENWPWLLANDRLEVAYHSIHYLDALRFLIGEPTHVFALGASYPDYPARAETRVIIALAFEDERRGLIHDEHHSIAPTDDWFALFRVEGTDGIADGSVGALYDYPVGRADTLRFTTRHVHRDTWIRPRLEGKWFPDAFAGPMASLLRAIGSGGEPETSGSDNLRTLRLVHAAYRSMAERRSVAPDEIGPAAP